jgi:hypothetical protein
MAKTIRPALGTISLSVTIETAEGPVSRREATTMDEVVDVMLRLIRDSRRDYCAIRDKHPEEESPLGEE